MISVGGLWTFIIVVLAVALLLWLAHYVVTNMVTDPQLAKILHVIAVVLAVLIIVGMLFNLAGYWPGDRVIVP